MSGEFLLLYSVFRIVCEQFREPDAALILGVSRGIFYSVFLIAGGVFLVWRSYRLPAIEIPYTVNPSPAPKEQKKAGRKR
jgi:phosphatidylglycerol:prolipoprotein diacylglycerol transferase